MASIIYHDTLELFKKSCKVITNYSNTNDLVKQQFNKKEIKLEDLKLKPECDKRYLNAITNHLKNKERQESKEDDSRQLLDRLYRKFPKSDPDTLINEIEFLQSNLYKASELSAYYTLAKEYNFDLSKKILEWVKKLMKLIYNKS